MTKVLEAYCTLHWKGEPQERVLATARDVALEWDALRVVLDLCALHKREVDAGKWPLPELLAMGDPAAPAPPGLRGRQRAGKGHSHGKYPQPTGAEADAVRAWIKANNFRNKDYPDIYAFQRGQGGGYYVPVGLLERWAAEGKPGYEPGAANQLPNPIPAPAGG
jgi:hypothetical protein